jgi:hypothetical protein
MSNTEQTLEERIAAYVLTLRDDIYEDSVFSYTIISDKWCRISSKSEKYKTNTVSCFVALKDYETKQLGEVKAGNIHKSAGWTRPARRVIGQV